MNSTHPVYPVLIPNIPYLFNLKNIMVFKKSFQLGFVRRSFLLKQNNENYLIIFHRYIRNKKLEKVETFRYGLPQDFFENRTKNTDGVYSAPPPLSYGQILLLALKPESKTKAPQVKIGFGLIYVLNVRLEYRCTFLHHYYLQMIGWKVLTVLLPAVVLAQNPGGETKTYNPSLTMQECSGNQNCQSGKHTNNRSY